MTRFWPGLFIVFGCLSARSAKLSPPERVWSDFDPRAEPLEIEVLKRWCEHEANYTEFLFTGLTNGPEKVRVYAIYSAPVGGTNLPAVLHIHGGGQTVNPLWLRFWNDRGYAALTFNWGGHWTNREKYTRWGSLTQGNHEEARSMMEATQPSVRASSWYLWTRVSRRALTALEQQPEVNSQKLGIFGVSMGGTITWPFAGTDTRVKAACAIYGVGWLTYPDEVDTPDARAGDPATRFWRETMASEAYAPLVRCPILYLDGSNDFYGKMDWAFRTLASVTAKTRWSFTARHNHHIAAAQAGNLPLWMDYWLKGIGPIWPKTPAVALNLGRGSAPECSVSPDLPEQARMVRVYYAVENKNPKTRFWRNAMVRRRGYGWTASLPILDPAQPLFAFANVDYESGVSISSTLLTELPSKLGKARVSDKPSLLIDDFSNGAADWIAPLSGPDPIPPVLNLVTNRVIGKRRGIGVTRATPLLTNKIGDPKWRGPNGARLQFKVFSASPREIIVTLRENERGHAANEVVGVRKIVFSNEWQTLNFEASDFKDENGALLRNWQKICILELTTRGGSDPQPLYTDFVWVPGRTHSACEKAQ